MKPTSDSAEDALPAFVRVLVIGGGFAGVATAYALARAGCGEVLVLEREDTCGYHASGRNAALGRQLTEDEQVTALTTRGAAFLREPPAGFSDTPLWNQTGSVLLGDSDAELAEMEARARRWELPHERLAPAELARRWPTLGAALAGVPTAGGVHVPSDGVIDVHALLQGFLRGARAGGVRVALGCEVVDMKSDAMTRSRGACVVTVERGGERAAVRCEIVVNAAGAWVEELGRRAGARPPHYAPIQRHLFITEPIAALERDAPLVWHVGREEFYLRPEQQGFLLSGCDETEVAPYDAVPAANAREALAEKLGPLAPGLAEHGIARVWACLRTFTSDRRPVIGWDSDVPWLFWVAGLGGHGATGSAAVGERAAAMLLERLAAR
ncbi:NAD(P)/FAD-dependent oxidoreductase [Haliangium ochraceum]|uniref:FAD dependent oxidoreductase n=1 Tax=Haliangium ochraceum (strain DSM 14365 / JCM 11303 / SMP-2) TaxID=502025 RepID=D0LK41_HALO1|nr:FAD-dependent oxidoreductase [Haliangium ochraceum]ACY13075.1 FAD dependent oxidoreductase [Haliangium ochraceum DSM 14365]